MRNQLWSAPPFQKMPDRRIRKARFKDRDLRVLIDSVMEKRGDIFGEGGQPPTMQSRRQAWLFVMEKVNAVSGTRRTWEEVRKKVHDLKKSTKEKLAYNRRARQLSCGGRPDIKTLTEFENDMILLFGKESFEGLDTMDLSVMSRLSDQGETSGSSITAAKQHRTPKYQISSPQAEAGTSIDTPTGGGGSVEDEEELVVVGLTIKGHFIFTLRKHSILLYSMINVLNGINSEHSSISGVHEILWIFSRVAAK
eukprot:g47301.t1